MDVVEEDIFKGIKKEVAKMKCYGWIGVIVIVAIILAYSIIPEFYDMSLFKNDTRGDSFGRLGAVITIIAIFMEFQFFDIISKKANVKVKEKTKNFVFADEENKLRDELNEILSPINSWQKRYIFFLLLGTIIWAFGDVLPLPIILF